MQNKYLIVQRFAHQTQNNNFNVKTFSTARTPEETDNTYRYLPIDNIRENIITFWLFMLQGPEKLQKEFITAGNIPDLKAPTADTTVFEWFDNNTPQTRQGLIALAQFIINPI